MQSATIIRASSGSNSPIAATPTEQVRFADLGLYAPILEAVREQGYEIPTPIQAQAIGPIMQGRDVLGCAQTGTGKTAAFALPLLHRLCTIPVDHARRGPVLPRVLVLSPTRELALQIDESFRTYGKHTPMDTVCIFGGVSQFHQVRSLHRGVDILVATPGRLIDLIQQGYVNLTQVKMFVLDEADRMLDMGFIDPIRQIASLLPKPRQTLLFSATMPREITHLAESLLVQPVRITVAAVASAVPLIEQSLFIVGREKKQDLLRQMLTSDTVERAIVFTRTKHGADKVAKRLNQTGVPAVAIHGNRSQSQRNRAMDGFRSGRSRVLVATDVAARGIDVDNITHVFNFDLPNEPESYVHRIGRTGRAGATGKAISFCDPTGEERGFLRAIERVTRRKIPVEQTPVIEVKTFPGESADSSYEDRDWQSERGGRGGNRGGGRGGDRGGDRGGRGGSFRGNSAQGPRGWEASPVPQDRMTHAHRVARTPDEPVNGPREVPAGDSQPSERPEVRLEPRFDQRPRFDPRAQNRSGSFQGGNGRDNKQGGPRQRDDRANGGENRPYAQPHASEDSGTVIRASKKPHRKGPRQTETPNASTDVHTKSQARGQDSGPAMNPSHPQGFIANGDRAPSAPRGSYPRAGGHRSGNDASNTGNPRGDSSASGQRSYPRSAPRSGGPRGGGGSSGGPRGGFGGGPRQGAGAGNRAGSRGRKSF